MNELKNIQVLLISLVDKAANKKSIIWKSNSPDSHNIEKLIQFKKQDNLKHLVYGIVYSPNQEDAHGDFATPEEIEKACYGFMKSLNSTSKVDVQHSLEIAEGVHIVENWIVKSADALFPDEQGAWAVGIKVENDEIWKSVEGGELTGLSMYGFAERTEDGGAEDKTMKGLLKVIKNFFNNSKEMDKQDKLIKDFNSALSNNILRDYVYALESAMYEVLYDENITDKKAAILENIGQFNAKMEEIEIAKTEIAKAGKVISDSNMKKLQSALEAIQSIMDAAKTVEEKKEKLTKQNKDTEMTAEEIKKQIDEAVEKATKPLNDKIAELEKSNKDLTDENVKVKSEKESLEKASNGSRQGDEPAGEPTTEVKKSHPWLGSDKMKDLK